MTRTLTALAVLALLLPSAAAAQGTNAPPGNSAIDEYLETVPSATGNARPRAPAHSGTSSALTATQRKELEDLGPDGKTLTVVIDQTDAAPAGTRRSRPGTVDPEVATPPGEIAEARARSPLHAALTAAVGPGDGEGMGALLPALLLTSLLGVMFMAAVRRRNVG